MHKFKVGDRVRDVQFGDLGIVTEIEANVDETLIWVQWDQVTDRSSWWSYPQEIELVNPLHEELDLCKDLALLCRCSDQVDVDELVSSGLYSKERINKLVDTLLAAPTKNDLSVKDIIDYLLEKYNV